VVDTIEVKTGLERRLFSVAAAATGGPYEGGIEWSPDGSLLAMAIEDFSRDPDDETWQVMIMKASGTVVRRDDYVALWPSDEQVWDSNETFTCVCGEDETIGAFDVLIGLKHSPASPSWTPQFTSKRIAYAGNPEDDTVPVTFVTGTIDQLDVRPWLTFTPRANATNTGFGGVGGLHFATHLRPGV